jgi:delta 1-pyrroline-5-carboxylate dehydrogenase
MAAIDVDDIARQMVESAKAVLGERWPGVKIFVESESRKFAQSMADIAVWRSTGEITEEQAEVLSRLHQRSMKMVLTSLEGISLAIAEKSLNAAIAVVRTAVNSAIGWNIL